jgi:L-ascorbate metabolism protein UlaG (beta-lactamase superfamily)
MNAGPLPIEFAPVVLFGIYFLGVIVGLLTIDARGASRIALALLWPLGPIAFIVTVSVLFMASLIAFPVFGAIVIMLALALVAFAQPIDERQSKPPALEARFIGNMAFAISDGTTTLFSDFPYQSGYSVYMKYEPREGRSSTAQSISLITHRHGDHWDRALFDRTDWRVIAPEDALTDVASHRIVRALPVKPTPVTVSVGPLTVEALPTPHANIGHYSYLVTWLGRRLYFTGDTDHVDQLLAMKNLDVAFVSPWLHQRVVRTLRRIDARRVIIYHHTVDERVRECREGCTVPKQGETLTF